MTKENARNKNYFHVPNIIKQIIWLVHQSIAFKHAFQFQLIKLTANHQPNCTQLQILACNSERKSRASMACNASMLWYVKLWWWYDNITEKWKLVKKRTFKVTFCCSCVHVVRCKQEQKRFCCKCFYMSHSPKEATTINNIRLITKVFLGLFFTKKASIYIQQTTYYLQLQVAVGLWKKVRLFSLPSNQMKGLLKVRTFIILSKMNILCRCILTLYFLLIFVL